jgi:hypothetical protein
MRDPPPLRVDLRPSGLRRIFIVTTHVATAVLLAAMPLDAFVRAWSVVLVGALAARAWREDAPAALIVRLDATLAVLGRDGASREARLVGGYLSTLVTTIVYRPIGSRVTRAVAILPDMLARDDFRKLRVRLAYARSDDVAERPSSHARASISTPLSDLRCRPIKSR